MKLEFKHIAPYLPYNLKVMVDDGAADEIIIIYPKDLGFQTSRAFFGNINEIKPVLRPINSMTKEEAMGLLRVAIPESKGVKFDVVVDGNSVSFRVGGYHSYDAYEIIIKNGVSLSERVDINDLQDYNLPCNFEAYKYLFSKHFDVFGLIDRGLAIEGNK